MGEGGGLGAEWYFCSRCFTQAQTSSLVHAQISPVSGIDIASSPGQVALWGRPHRRSLSTVSAKSPFNPFWDDSQHLLTVYLGRNLDGHERVEGQLAIRPGGP